MNQKIIACFIAISITLNLSAQELIQTDIFLAEDTALLDSIVAVETSVPVNNTPYQFRPTQLILPGALIAVGSWGVCNGWISKIKHDIKDDMTRLRGNHYIHVDDYVQYLPTAAYVAMGCVGVKSRLRFKERLVVTATAYMAMGIMVNGIKYTVGEKRPDSSARNSFPSGHTATVFMGAELIRHDYSLGIAIGAYSIAVGTAFLRMYNERHWLNDVLAGAGIGILSARIGYWLLPFNRRIFRISPRSTSALAALPSYDPANRAFGLAFAATF